MNSPARHPLFAKRFCSTTTAALLGLASTCALFAADAPAPPAGGYATDFSKFELGKPPEEIFILSGEFEVVDGGGGDKCLQLAGDPVDSFGVLFGPENMAACEVTARIAGSRIGRIFPEYGIGSNDAGGYKVWLLPGQDAVVLRKGDNEVARAPFKWADGAWTRFKLRLAPEGTSGKWKVQGKAWPAQGSEPAEWMLSFDEPEAPSPGRASVWGHPYASTPIRFDDLSVAPAK